MADMPPAWETLEQTTAYSCPGFDIIRDTVRLPDGTETAFDYLSEPPSVAVVPFIDEETVVVIDEWRQAVNRVSTGLPVGTTEPTDDSLRAAAQRELAEETGYQAGALEPLITVEPANGIADVELHVFVARDCEQTGTQQLDRNETIAVRTMPFADLRSAVRSGEIRDGRTALAVAYYCLTE